MPLSYIVLYTPPSSTPAARSSCPRITRVLPAYTFNACTQFTGRYSRHAQRDITLLSRDAHRDFFSETCTRILCIADPTLKFNVSTSGQTIIKSSTLLRLVHIDKSTRPSSQPDDQLKWGKPCGCEVHYGDSSRVSRLGHMHRWCRSGGTGARRWRVRWEVPHDGYDHHSVEALCGGYGGP